MNSVNVVVRRDDPIEAEIRELAAHLDAATHRFLTLIRAYDAKGSWAGWGIRSCAHWLSWKCGLSARAARERVRVARALGELPLVDGALATGELSYSKERALVRVATPESEAKLVRAAKTATASQLERICRGIAQVRGAESPHAEPQRWVITRRGDGEMVRIEAQLHADEAAIVLRAIDELRRARGVSAETRDARPGETVTVAEPEPQAVSGAAPTPVPVPESEPEPVPPPAPEPEPAPAPAPEPEPEPVSAKTHARPPMPSRADALVKLAELALAPARRPGPGYCPEPARTGGDRATLLVHLGPNDLISRHVATLEDGTRVSAETLRRLACDAGLVAVLGDGTGETGRTLDVGRKTRSIPPAVRRALLLRDRTCRFPGCTHSCWLDAHHVEHWLHGGETKLENLVLLCPFHHRLVHEGGFTVELAAGRTVVFRDPERRVLTLSAIQPLAPAAALSRLRADNENAGADIDENTCGSGWRGERVDYSYVVGRLA